MEQNYMEILFEEMRGKFDLVLEGQTALHVKIDEYRRESNEKHDLTAFKIQILADRIDSLDAKIDFINQKLTAKIDAVATDLTAHRADTEAHPRYLVRE